MAAQKPGMSARNRGTHNGRGVADDQTRKYLSPRRLIGLTSSMLGQAAKWCKPNS